MDAKKINAVDAPNLLSEEPSSESGFESLLTTPNLIVAGLLVVSLFLLLAIVRGRGRKSQRDKEWEIQTATWGIADDPWDTPSQNYVPPPPTTSAQAESLFQAADRIESGNTGREEYVPSRPVMSPVRPVVDNALLDDLNAGTPQKTSNSELDTSFLDDLL